MAAFLGLVLIFTTTCVVKGEKICYRPFGCFSDEAPFEHYLMTNPQLPKDVGTTFTVHTEYRKRLFTDFHSRSMAAAAGMLKTSKLMIVIHGMLESSDKNWVRDLTNALLAKGDVIVIDWGKGATSFVAGGNARLVGAQVAYLLKYILRRSIISQENIHMIGFSLGAHVAGYTGRRLIEDGYKLGRITGLDAGDLPYGTRVFENAHPSVRLDTTDADFVDVIHTDLKGLGIDQPIGHLDFYPNGGDAQPGCGVVATIKALGNVRSHENFFRAVGCNHIRAVDFFIESLSSTSCKFIGYPCKGFKSLKSGGCKRNCYGGECPVMGYESVAFKKMGNLTGTKLYLETNGKAPFCKPRIEKKQAKIWTVADFFSRVKSIFW